MNRKVKHIVVYGTAGCEQCKFFKRTFDARGIRYDEFDVGADEAAMARVKEFGFKDLPITVVPDNLLYFELEEATAKQNPDKPFVKHIEEEGIYVISGNRPNLFRHLRLNHNEEDPAEPIEACNACACACQL